MAAHVCNITLRSELDMYLFHLVVPIYKICSETAKHVGRVFPEKEVLDLLMKMDL